MAKLFFGMEIVLDVGCVLQQHSMPCASRSRPIFAAVSAFLIRGQRRLRDLDKRD